MKSSRLLSLLFGAFILAAVTAPSVALASTEKPTSTWNLATQGQYNFSGSAQLSNLYSNYNFTGVSSAKIYVSNRSVSDSLIVKLIRNDALFDTTVSTATVPKNGATAWTVTGMTTSNKYYLRFSAPSNFTGYIRKP